MKQVGVSGLKDATRIPSRFFSQRPDDPVGKNGFDVVMNQNPIIIIEISNQRNRFGLPEALRKRREGNLVQLLPRPQVFVREICEKINVLSGFLESGIVNKRGPFGTTKSSESLDQNSYFQKNTLDKFSFVSLAHKRIINCSQDCSKIQNRMQLDKSDYMKNRVTFKSNYDII